MTVCVCAGRFVLVGVGRESLHRFFEEASVTTASCPLFDNCMGWGAEYGVCAAQRVYIQRTRR